MDATAAIASPRSLFIRAVAKPGAKSLLAGELGTGPGTGQLVWTAQQLPVAPVQLPAAVAPARQSSPTLVARTCEGVVELVGACRGGNLVQLLGLFAASSECLGHVL